MMLCPFVNVCVGCPYLTIFVLVPKSLILTPTLVRTSVAQCVSFLVHVRMYSVRMYVRMHTATSASGTVEQPPSSTGLRAFDSTAMFFYK